MAAFREALEHGYGIELDIHLMKDGNLAVFHDSSLKRVAGADGNIEDLTLADLENYTLGNSQEHIPLFSQVLELYRGKAPLIVELKCVNGNYAALCKAALELLDQYEGLFCVESFDPRATRWLRKNRPDIIRGQLSENCMKSGLKLPWVLKFVMSYHISNIYTRPDFIAYKYADRNVFGTDICRKFWGIQGVSWTLKTPEEYETAVNEGWIPIFEGFEP
jgi:glycerophosphoryl diester phosphodiesterase